MSTEVIKRSSLLYPSLCLALCLSLFPSCTGETVVDDPDDSQSDSSGTFTSGSLDGTWVWKADGAKKGQAVEIRIKNGEIIALKDPGNAKPIKYKQSGTKIGARTGAVTLVYYQELDQDFCPGNDEGGSGSGSEPKEKARYRHLFKFPDLCLGSCVDKKQLPDILSGWWQLDCIDANFDDLRLPPSDRRGGKMVRLEEG